MIMTIQSILLLLVAGHLFVLNSLCTPKAFDTNGTSLITAPADAALGPCPFAFPAPLTFEEAIVDLCPVDGNNDHHPVDISPGAKPAAPPKAGVVTNTLSTTPGSVNVCFIPPSSLVQRSSPASQPGAYDAWVDVDEDVRRNEDKGEVDWAGLALLAQRACFVALVFFLTLRSRQLVDGIKSSVAAATALESLNTVLEASISGFEHQFRIQASALGRFPALLVSLGDAVARLADVEATIGTRIDDEFGRAIRHMQGIIALHNRRSRLEDDMDWMQSSLEGRRCSTANSDAAADEEVVSLLEQLTESEDRLEDAETKTHERLTAAKSVKVGIDDAGAECHLVLVERDGLRKHLAYMHTSNCLEAEDCDADVAGLEAQRTLLETSCEQTIYRADITTSKVDALTEEVDHIVLASHHAQQALIGDLAGASSEASSLAADLAKQDTELTDLKTTHSALEDSCSQLDEHAESLESTLAQLEADEVGLRATSLKEADDHQERVMALEAEHDAVDASHAAAVEKLSKVKADADRVAQETLALVGSLREKQAANKVRFDEATAALKASIARDDADIAERKAACVAQEHSLKVTKAALDTRNDVFRLHAQDYERDMEASWSLGKESGYDRQQYESMLDEASNKAARARRQQADAEAKAAAARQHSDEVAKETAVTRHAFTTQLGDLEAQRTALGSANAAFATSSEQLRADNSALGAKLEHLKKAHDDEKRPLSIRLRSAEADMARFKMTEAEAVNRLDVQIAGLATEEEGLNGKMAEYQSELGRVYGMTEGVERAVSEASLALSVEKGQALALLKLIRYPSSDPEFIAAYWTPETPSEGASSRPPERYDSCSAIFDASFEEALERDIAESKTCDGLANAGLGLDM